MSPEGSQSFGWCPIVSVFTTWRNTEAWRRSQCSFDLWRRIDLRKQSGKLRSSLDRVGCSWFLSKNQICRLGHAAPSVFWACIYCGKMAGFRRQIFIPSAVEIPTQRWYQLPAREYSRRELIADRLVNFGGLFGVDLYEPALVICPPRSELLASAWHP